MEDQFLLFKSKISRMGDRYVIYVPAGLKPAAERLHGLSGVVYFIPYTVVERHKTLCEVEFTKRAKQVRAKTIKCGDLELEVKNEKVGRELVLYLPLRKENIFDWKEIVLVLTRIASEVTIGEEFGEHELTCDDRVYAAWLSANIMMYVL